MTYSGTERRSIVLLMNCWLAPSLYARNASMCSRVYPIFQYDKHIVHCVLGSVSSNSHNSMLPTSWIICFDSGLKGLNGWFCRRSCWRACRSGRFSIFWIKCRTLVLCAYFTTECGSPGIRKSMSASFTIIDSWLTSWSATDLSVLSRSVFIFNVVRFAFMSRTSLRTVWHSNHVMRDNRSHRSLMCLVQRWTLVCLLINVFGLHSSHERVFP